MEFLIALENLLPVVRATTVFPAFKLLLQLGDAGDRRPRAGQVALATFW
jgi:hypothetical protein